MKVTEHARNSIRDDGYEIDEILKSMNNFKIIEQYDDAKPFPACLLLCKIRGKAIHVVCGLPEHADMLIIITTYIPSDKNWSNYATRRK